MVAESLSFPAYLKKSFAYAIRSAIARSLFLFSALPAAIKPLAAWFYPPMTPYLEVVEPWVFWLTLPFGLVAALMVGGYRLYKAVAPERAFAMRRHAQTILREEDELTIEVAAWVTAALSNGDEGLMRIYIRQMIADRRLKVHGPGSELVNLRSTVSGFIRADNLPAGIRIRSSDVTRLAERFNSADFVRT